MSHTQFTIYEIATGKVLCTTSVPTSIADTYEPPPGTAVLDALVEDPDRVYVDTSSGSPVLVTIPHPPSEYYHFDYTTKTWVPDLERADWSARSIRAGLLQQSDWTQLPDVPLATKEAWAAYRQALRDISLQPGFPLDVNWPISPIG